MRRQVVGFAAGCLVALVALGVLAPVAQADGLPVLGIDVGASGVASPGGTLRYVTLPAGRLTQVAAVRKAGGQVVRSTLYPGTFTIPAVAYDGSAAGLSGDGKTLVLIEPRAGFPRTTTTLLVLDARTLRSRALVNLRGDFSFDAVSPHGARMYLINYVSPRDPTRYVVRAFDLTAMKLIARPVVDLQEHGAAMRGNPLSRATSADGRWAYTLYDGYGGTPFVHALDTARMTAHCVDLDALALRGAGTARLRMAADGRSVEVVDKSKTILAVDTSTLAVGVPSQAKSIAWSTVALLALGGGVLCALLLALRRRRPLPLGEEAIPVD